MIHLIGKFSITISLLTLISFLMNAEGVQASSQQSSSQAFCELTLAKKMVIFEPSPSAFLSTGFARKKVAVINAGENENLLEIEDELRQLGVQAVVIHEPTVKDIENLTLEKGYFFGPFAVSQRQQTPELPLVEALIAEIDNRDIPKKGKKRADIRRKFQLNDNYALEVGRFHASDMLEWKTKVFEKSVLGKEYGVDTVSDAYVESLVKYDAEEHPVYQVVIREKSSGELVAATFAKVIEDGATLKVERADSLKDGPHTNQNLSYSAVAAMVDVARENGIKTLSYGTDPNSYGELASLGLLDFKTSIGFSPVSGEHAMGHNLGHARLVKWLSIEGMDSRAFVTFTYHENIVGDQLIANIIGDPSRVKLPYELEVRVFNELPGL